MGRRPTEHVLVVLRELELVAQEVEKLLHVGVEVLNGAIDGQEAVHLHRAAVVVTKVNLPLMPADLDMRDGRLGLTDGPDAAQLCQPTRSLISGLATIRDQSSNSPDHDFEFSAAVGVVFIGIREDVIRHIGPYIPRTVMPLGLRR